MTVLYKLYPVFALVLASSFHALTLASPIGRAVRGASQDETHNVRPDIPSDDVTPLSPSEVAYFEPYTWYASAGQCKPNATMTWDCGLNCDANPTFIPVKTGGDGAVTQFWFVGYDPTLKEVIVSHQGTDGSEIIPILTDLDIKLRPLDEDLFPRIDQSILVHDGFASTQARSAPGVLSAVQETLETYQADQVTVVGVSLGAAIALLDSVYLPLHLPNSTRVRAIVYGLPRVGNQEFADYVDAHSDITPVTHISRNLDPVPSLPLLSLGYHQPQGEIHVTATDMWLLCPGQDNPSPECAAGAVNLTHWSGPDHSGPFDGVHIQCDM
ncbi:lipase [Daedaleopsis nitida]|nr:lipase [Daedaleopsis nitida]